MIYVVFRPQMILCEIFGPYLCCIQYCIFVLYFLKQSRSIAIWELSTFPQFFKRETALGRFFIWGSLGFKRYLTDPLDRLDSSVLTFGQLDIYCLSKNACKCLKMLKANRSLRVTGNKFSPCQQNPGLSFVSSYWDLRANKPCLWPGLMAKQEC